MELSPALDKLKDDVWAMVLDEFVDVKKKVEPYKEPVVRAAQDGAELALKFAHAKFILKSPQAELDKIQKEINIVEATIAGYAFCTNRLAIQRFRKIVSFAASALIKTAFGSIPRG